MATLTYAQVLSKIKAALSLRQAGTKVAVSKHEEAEIAILDYIEAAKSAFIEKHNSPYVGTINPVLTKVIKDWAVREREDQVYFYIGIVQCILDGSSYYYNIVIYQAVNLEDPHDDPAAFEFSGTPDAPYTGLVSCVLQESDGSGRYGNMLVDWSQIPLGSTFTSQSYAEGGLSTPSLISDMGSIGGGGSFLKREGFRATEGQTIFTPTKFKMSGDAMIFVNNALQDEDTYTIVGNTLEFTTGLTADDKVTILN